MQPRILMDTALISDVVSVVNLPLWARFLTYKICSCCLRGREHRYQVPHAIPYCYEMSCVT